MLRCSTAFSQIFKTRRPIAIVVLLAYALAVGVVVVPVIPDKSPETPFPCENHACGCCSAEQCWKSCCCFTREQKIAWAKVNNVVVPYHLLGEESVVAEKSQSNEHEGLCCSMGSGDRGSLPNKPCCSHGNCCSKKVEKHTECLQDPDGNGPRTISITDVMSCRGLQMLWILAPPSLTGAQSDDPYLTLPRSFEFLRWSDDLLVSGHRSPPVPPPRLG